MQIDIIENFEKLSDDLFNKEIETEDKYSRLIKSSLMLLEKIFIAIKLSIII